MLSTSTQTIPITLVQFATDLQETGLGYAVYDLVVHQVTVKNTYKIQTVYTIHFHRKLQEVLLQRKVEGRINGGDTAQITTIF